VGGGRRGVGVVVGLERARDPDERLAGLVVDALLAQEDAAELNGGVAEGVPLDGVGGGAVEEDGQVAGRRDLVGEAGVAAVAVGAGGAPRGPGLCPPPKGSVPGPPPGPPPPRSSGPPRPRPCAAPPPRRRACPPPP